MPVFGFLAIGAGLALVYAGWLGIAPTQVVRDLFTGTPLPKRRGVLEPKAAAPTAAPMPAQPSAPIYPTV